jgi:hypothetical protein
MSKTCESHLDTSALRKNSRGPLRSNATGPGKSGVNDTMDNFFRRVAVDLAGGPNPKVASHRRVARMERARGEGRGCDL